MFDLVKNFQEKEFLCIHDNVDDLIKSALNSKLLLINPKSQHLDKKEQKIKNVKEQQAERRNRAEKSLQNFRVTLEDKIECDMPAKDDCSLVFTTFSNPHFKDNDHLDSSDNESLSDEDVPAEEFKIYSNSLFDKDEINSDKLNPHCFNVKSNFVESLLNQLNAEIADTIIEYIPLLPIPVQDGNSQQEEIDIVTKTDDVLPSSDDNDDDDYDLLLGEADLFLSDDSIPLGIENFTDDPEGDIRFLEELLIDDSILSHESFDSSFEDNPSISRPPPEPPDNNFDLEPEVISAVMEDIDEPDEPDEHFNPGGEICVSTNNEDVDYFPFMFVIRIFLPYLILPEISPLFLSAESEDTIFDPALVWGSFEILGFKFWSTARIETIEEGTKILATVDGIHRTVTESSLRRNLKLIDEEGISSLHDTELFENLTLMGYNISPNQKFTFQTGKDYA
nr:hypothetical protein [Tanacetum cinerariifolium]